MSKFARYTVIVDRQVGEHDGGGVYHDGTGAAGVEQLSKELQEAFDCGHIEGHFKVTARRIVESTAVGAPSEAPAIVYEDVPPELRSKPPATTDPDEELHNRAHATYFDSCEEMGVRPLVEISRYTNPIDDSPIPSVFR